MDNRFIQTIDFGYVPIRKTYTEGRHYKDITLSDPSDVAQFAEIRIDDRTNQPFAVLFDKDWKELKEVAHG